MTGQNRNWQRRLGVTAIAVAAMLTSLLIVSLASAAPDSPGPQGWGDDGTLEVGVEWINDFPGTADDRDHWDESCDGLYNKLRGAGWVGRFRWTDWNAWEEEWKDEPRAGGGREDSVADTVDIAMLCTHGSGAWDSFWNKNLSSVYFGSTRDDHDLVPGDAYMAYGDNDLEWLAFDSCSVLSDGPAALAPYYNRGYWAASMNGLHLLLGFRNTMYVVAGGDGDRWADYMLGWKWLGIWLRPPRTVKQAWFDAVDDRQPGGVCARVLAQEGNNYNDYLWGLGYVSPDYAPDGDYQYWDHCSCTPKPLQIENVNQIQSLPVYEVVGRQIDENYVREIAAALGMSGTIGTDGDYYYMVDATRAATYTLQVDRTTGGYKYENLSQLSVAPVDPPRLPTGDEALVLGNRYFAGPGQRLPAAAYRTGPTQTMTEEKVEVQVLLPGAEMTQVTAETRTPVLMSLSYGRVVTPEVGVMTAAGVQRLQETISIVGPGARLKMYLGDMGDILGMQGGSRDIRNTGQQVTIMEASKAWDMYLADPTIALAQIPWVADRIVKSGETLSYYEQPHAQGQKEMIPAWIFTADFFSGQTLLADDVLVYVPAAAIYLRPDVKINSPTTGASFKAGQAITFSGAVVQNGQPPFTYAWTSSRDGFLGSGATIVAPLSPATKESAVISHTISLQVTDANGQQGAAKVEVLVRPSTFLPVILKR